METVQTRIQISTKRVAKKKKNQLPLAIGGVIVALIIAIFLYALKPFIVGIWFFGILFGFILQKSRFCFTASLRDPVLTGSTSLTKAVLIAIMVASAGFAILQFYAMQRGVKIIPGNLAPVGWHIAIGAVMFGFGMVVAGACASGSLMRIGEGYLLQVITLIGMIIGATWGAHDFFWWKQVFIANSKPIFLPKVLGWPLAIIVQFTILFTLYFIADKLQKRNIEK